MAARPRLGAGGSVGATLSSNVGLYRDNGAWALNNVIRGSSRDGRWKAGFPG